MNRWAKRILATTLLAGSLLVSGAAPVSAACSDEAAPNVDWSDCDLGRINLDGKDLSGANLAGADFRNATITNVNFVGAEFDGALFAPDADVSGSVFLLLPEGVADSATTNQETSTLIDVLDNDLSENTGPAARLIVGAIDGPSHGSVTVEGSSIRYTPDVGYSGPDSFVYVPLATLDLDNLPSAVVFPVPGVEATVTLNVVPGKGDPPADPPTDPPVTDPPGDKGPVSPLTGTYAGLSGAEAQIARLYAAYFGRNPDDGGFDYWLGRLEAGEVTLRYVSAAFEDSAEFQDTYGSLSDDAFVDLVYTNVFDRLPDAGGKAYWLGQLADGMTRGEMMLFFSDSAEYRSFTGTT